jgi:hypothetical protein
MDEMPSLNERRCIYLEDHTTLSPLFTSKMHSYQIDIMGLDLKAATRFSKPPFKLR